MGDPARGQQRLRSGDGGRPCRLSARTRSRSSSGLPGRVLQAIDRRNSRADQDEEGPQSPLRLRIRAQWNGQSVHDVCAAGRLATRESHRSPHGHRLRRRPQGPGRYPLPQRQDITLVQDNLNIHTKASLYEAFPAAEARRLAERFEFHYTPKHGSWLDLAESELGVLASQCLDRRIADKPKLIEEIAAWPPYRNKHQPNARWHFTTNDARIKLSRLYPQFE